VSASRTPERVLESPQLKEWELQILKVSVSYFYDGLENMKEVQMNTSSLSLSQSTPVVLQQWQIRVSCSWLMEWTMLPLLNFVLGNLIEFQRLMFKVWSYFQGHLLLYGANAFNGILFMTSQSPFTSQGLLRFGQTSQKLLGQTTMLIMELEWRMRLVQTCRKS
jgi:hypothetical protein